MPRLILGSDQGVLRLGLEICDFILRILEVFTRRELLRTLLGQQIQDLEAYLWRRTFSFPGIYSSFFSYEQNSQESLW